MALPLRYGAAVGMERQRQSPATGINIDWSKFNPDEIQLPPGEDSGSKSMIVVDNLPVVEPAKFEKLEGVVRRIFGQTGAFRTLYMPKDEETGNTLGYAFIEYSTPQEAQAAREKTDSCKLDRFHVLVVRMFDDSSKADVVVREYNSRNGTTTY